MKSYRSGGENGAATVKNVTLHQQILVMSSSLWIRPPRGHGKCLLTHPWWIQEMCEANRACQGLSADPPSARLALSPRAADAARRSLYNAVRASKMALITTDVLMGFTAVSPECRLVFVRAGRGCRYSLHVESGLPLGSRCTSSTSVKNKNAGTITLIFG